MEIYKYKHGNIQIQTWKYTNTNMEMLQIQTWKYTNKIMEIIQIKHFCQSHKYDVGNVEIQ